mgnify:CR=1 FL=1
MDDSIKIINLAKAKELYNVKADIMEKFMDECHQNLCEKMSDAIANAVEARRTKYVISGFDLDTLNDNICKFDDKIEIDETDFKELAERVANTFIDHGFTVNLEIENGRAYFNISGWA